MKSILPQKIKEPLLARFPRLPLFAPYLLLLGVLALALGFYLVKFESFQSQKKPIEIVQEDPYLHVESVYGTSSSVKITFSDPVDPHLVAHLFIISPDVSGNFNQGITNESVIFTPTNGNLKDGITYSVQIGMGLKSLNGKVLQSDFQQAFRTPLASNQLQFTYDGLTGRVFTFPANVPNKILLQRGSGIAAPVLSIYKSTPEQFLAYLAYKTEKNQPNSYPQEIKTFFSNAIPHTQFQLIQSKQLNDEISDDSTFEVPKDAGIYYVEAKSAKGDIVGSLYLLVNTTGLLFRQDDHHMTLGAFNLATGEAITEPVSVKLYTSENSLVTRKSLELTDLSESIYDFDQPLDFIFATYKDESIFVPVNIPQSQAVIDVTENLSKVYKTFLYTDRPIYKPGDSVQFRGIVRVDEDALYTIPPEGTPVKISVTISYNPERKIETTATLQKSGVFWGFLSLPADYAPKEIWDQTKYMYASIDGKQRTTGWFGDAYFDIVAYKKPSFDIKTNVEKKEYLKQDEMNFTVEAKGFDGKPLANQTISYDIYQEEFIEIEKAVYNSAFNITRNSFGMCGGGFVSPFEEYYGSPIEEKKTVTTDEHGKATITYSLKDKSMDFSQKLTLLAYKTDDNNNKIISAISTIVHAANENIFLFSSPEEYTVGDTLKVPFYVESLNGEKVKNKTVSVALQNYEQNPTTYVQQLVTTDDQGKASAEFVVPQIPNGQTSVKFIASIKDTYDNVKIAYKYLQIYTKPPEKTYWDRFAIQPTFLKMKTNKNSYTVGDTLSITTTSPKTLTALLTMERGRIYQPRIIHIPQGESTISIPVTDELSPSISAVFSFFVDGKYYSEGLTLSVPSMHKLLTVSVTPDKPSYAPGETAHLTIKTTDPAGNPTPARLSMAVVDKAIFALRKNATPPIHSTFYAFRPRKINSSSSLTWVGTYDLGGRGGGGGENGLDGKNVDTLFWNPNIVTDSSGTVTVDVPLSEQITTWKTLVYGTTDTTFVGQAELDFLATK